MSDFWTNKKVLVTGAGGFIGSHLCEKLVHSGSKLKAFTRYNSSNSSGLLEFVPVEIRDKMEIIPGNVTDEVSLYPVLKDIEIVFHLAAIPSIPYSHLNPRQVFNVNTYGTMNLLLAASASGVKKVIIASSAGASEKRPLLSPYIMSKAAMEKVCLGFHEGLGVNLSILRLLNNYGPRQSARAIIPTIISQALVKNDVHLGSLDPRMDFNYVDDTINAFLLTAEHQETDGKVLTWGTGITTSIRELAHLIFSLIDKEGRNIITDIERIRASTGPMASLEKEILHSHKIINYKPRVDLQSGLKKTIGWISEYINLYKTDRYVI